MTDNLLYTIRVTDEQRKLLARATSFFAELSGVPPEDVEEVALLAAMLKDAEPGDVLNEFSL